jgi:hypothetical protein
VDIHLCIDAMRTLYNYPGINTFVLVTGDRDFIPLINTIRQHGKRAIVIGVGGAASSHLAQSADEFIFYNQLVDDLQPAKEAKDPFAALVEAVHLARKRNISATFASLKLLMIEIMGTFDQSKYKDNQGRAFSKFKDFIREAERRGVVKVFTSGSVNEVFFPGEDPYELSQYAPDRSAESTEPQEEPETEEIIEEEEKDLEGVTVEDWRKFESTMRQFDEPVLFIQIYDALRGLRNQEVIDLSNRQIRAMTKRAINEKMLIRTARAKHGYYSLNPAFNFEQDVQRLMS